MMMMMIKIEATVSRTRVLADAS